MNSIRERAYNVADKIQSALFFTEINPYKKLIRNAIEADLIYGADENKISIYMLNDMYDDACSGLPNKDSITGKRWPNLYFAIVDHMYDEEFILNILSQLINT